MVAQPIPDEWYEAPVYQVRMAAPDASGRTLSSLWGRTVSLFYFTGFSADELRERYKIDWEQAEHDPETAFRDLLARAFYDPALYVQAAWEDGRREQVTTVERTPRSQETSAVADDENLDAICGQMRMMIMQAPKRPGVGEMVWHLLKHRGRSGAETLKALKDHLGEQHVYPADLASHRRNGRQREKDGRPCRFCS